jgi:hypothetical protein
MMDYIMTVLFVLFMIFLIRGFMIQSSKKHRDRINKK